MPAPSDKLIPSACPVLPYPTEAEVDAILERPDGPRELAQFYHDRETAIAAARRDPYRHGFEFSHWRRADEELTKVDFLYVAGGKRASKSEWAAKRVVRSAMAYPQGVIWCFQDNEKTSINTQQEVVWRYLPPEIRALNNKNSPVYKVKYGDGRGFTEMFLVLPNGTKIFFLTYNQKPEEFQGWELGARVQVPAKDEQGKLIPNLGAWPDENLPIMWLQTIRLRLATRGAKMIWTFSPLRGITTTIKEFLGIAQTLESRPAELLPDRRNVHDCPEGHMPFIQQPTTNNARVVYFFTQWNPFGNYPAVKALLVDKPSEQVQQDAYGYSTDTMNRAFPNFGVWNIISAAALPATGTNYMVTDPAGARNWATIWVRVAPGKEPNIFIYREWPDQSRFGEWAVPSDNPLRPDGDAGPAQRGLGYGVVQYKQMFGREEMIRPVWKNEVLANPDPLHRKLLEQALAGKDTASAKSVLLAEPVYERWIDPRAGRNQLVAEKGGTCLIDEFADEQRQAPGGEVIGPRMTFWPASGVDIADGVTAINGLLSWDMEKPLMPFLNAPRLYVTEACKNVIWCLSNWTGLDGERGASKDFVDLCRYMATGNARHVEPGSLKVKGGGSY